MCGNILGDAFSFIKDSVGELASHPWQTLGAAAGVPGYDPFFGGLFNSGPGGAIISPTGNFTSGAWNDMYNANPGDSGALGTFSGINKVADMIAPAVAAPGISSGLGAAFGSLGGGAAGAGAGIGADTFTTGLGEAGAGGASTLGGLESGMGGAAMFGPTAGTGTAIGSELAANAGAGGLGLAGAGGLGSEFAGTGGTYAAGLGGGTAPGLGGGAVVPGNPSGMAGPVDLGGAGQSLEGGQAAMAPGGNPAAAGAIGPQQGSDLSAMYGPTSTATASPMGTAIGQSTAGVGGGVTPYGATLGQDLAQGAGAGGIGDYLKSPTGIQDLFKLGQQGLGAWQKMQQGNAARNYANSISGLFGPNSPYAQQMQQTLARTDAAQGRNSQYGTRATQLAAALTQAQANALGGSNYAQARQSQAGQGALTGLMGLFANTGAGSRLANAGFNSLSSLFGG